MEFIFDRRIFSPLELYIPQYFRIIIKGKIYNFFKNEIVNFFLDFGQKTVFNTGFLIENPSNPDRFLEKIDAQPINHAF